jgi:hypothetical protein
VDEHLLVVVGRSRHTQMEPDGPGTLANQAIKDQALQISAARTGQAPHRRPGGRAQITPLGAQPIAGNDLRQSAQIGGSARFAQAGGRSDYVGGRGRSPGSPALDAIRCPDLRSTSSADQPDLRGGGERERETVSRGIRLRDAR